MTRGRASSGHRSKRLARLRIYRGYASARASNYRQSRAGVLVVATQPRARQRRGERLQAAGSSQLSELSLHAHASDSLQACITASRSQSSDHSWEHGSARGSQGQAGDARTTMGPRRSGWGYRCQQSHQRLRCPLGVDRRYPLQLQRR